MSHIRQVYDNICVNQFPEEVFGEIKGSTVSERLSNLKTLYHALVREYHPDRYYDQDEMTQYIAGQYTGVINDFYQLARERVQEGVYGETRKSIPSKEEPEYEVTTKKATYRIYEHLTEGDIADIYRGEFEGEDGATQEVCLKIAQDSRDRDLIRNEVAALRTLSHKSLPVLLDTFTTEKNQEAVVLRFIEGMDLYEVLEKKPEGLPQEHVCWVFERLLSVLGFMHVSKVLHGNIEPGNIMIRPRDHNAFLIDLCFSLRGGDSFKVCSEDFSAPEVHAKRPPIPPSDMYSLGKCMQFLLGGNVSKNTFPDSVDIRIVRFIKQFLLENPMHRARDAWKMWGQLRDLRTEVFGPKRFQELKL